MARNRGKLGSLTHQVKIVLDNKLAIGQSKHLDKRNGGIRDKIYSWNTYKSYMKHANYFVKWVKEEHGARTLIECRPHVDEWLIKRVEEVSPYTQKLEASALAKVYGERTTDFVKTAVRHRGDISRSRGKKVRDRHFSEERNKEFVTFCKSTGLRRSEIQALKGDKLKFKDGNPYIVVDVGSKGGKYREVPIIGDRQAIMDRMQAVGSNRVFKKIPNGADVHGYRSEYANNLYETISRPIESIPYDKINGGSGKAYQSEVYVCRGDLKGVKYDKVAMLEVSRALGHNRISVIAGHYIRG